MGRQVRIGVQVAQRVVKGEPFYLYLAVTKYAISGTLVREEEKVQWPVYYISKRLINIEMRYPEMEKLGLYFLSYTIRVFTNYLLRQVLQKPDASGHLLKWAIELSQFKIEFQP